MAKGNFSVTFLTLLAIVTLLLAGCKKTTVYYVYLNNNSGVPLKLLPYRLGKVDSNSIRSIAIDETTQIKQGAYDSRPKHLGFENAWASSADSVICIFDDSFSITYYRIDPIHFAKHYYLLSNKRSFLNQANYYYYAHNGKQDMETYRFKFSVADFNYAKAQ